MAGTIETSTINIISPNGLVTKPLTVDNYGYAKIGDERVGVTPQNWIINGMFDVWQRGTSQTSDGYGSDDRWANASWTGSKTHSRQVFNIGQTDVPNNPTYFSRTVVTTQGISTNFCSKYQHIEDVIKLAGKTISLSFWAKADTSKNLAIEFVQNFGTGGSSSVLSIGIQKFTLTTSWKRFTKTITLPSISGKTVGANSSTFIRFWFDAGSDYNAETESLGNQSGTFDIANVCLVEGSVPVECPNEPYAEVLRKCQRYYVRFGGEALYQPIMFGAGVAATVGQFTITFPVKMRSIPSAIEYSNVGIADIGTGATTAITSITTVGVNLMSSAVMTIYAYVASGLTAYRPYTLNTNNSLAGYLAFTAEL